MREGDYEAIKKAVEGAGFFTTLHPNGDGGVWLVVVSRRTAGRLHGNSFRVSLKAGRWYLITRAPVYYLVPAGADLPAVCLDCLRSSRSAIGEVPPEIARRYGLLELSPEDYDRE